jgi:hypothetical protein
MPGWAAIGILLAAALIGVIATVVLRQDPGGVLGVCIFAGTVIAGLGANYRSAYLIIPVPALAYVIAAFIAGYIHDKSEITGHLQLAVKVGVWIGDGFSWMLVATVAAIVVAIGRWLWGRQDMLRGGSPGGPRRPGGPGGPGAPGSRPRPGAPGSRPRPGGHADAPRPGFTSAPAMARPAAGYARSTNPPRPADQPPARTEPPPLPLDQPPRRAIGGSPARPAKDDDDPFRRYYDSGDTWR